MRHKEPREGDESKKGGLTPTTSHGGRTRANVAPERAAEEPQCKPKIGGYASKAAARDVPGPNGIRMAYPGVDPLGSTFGANPRLSVEETLLIEVCSLLYSDVLYRSAAPPTPEQYAAPYIEESENAAFDEALLDNLRSTEFGMAVGGYSEPGYGPLDERLERAVSNWRESGYESEVDLEVLERVLLEVLARSGIFWDAYFRDTY